MDSSPYLHMPGVSDGNDEDGQRGRGRDSLFLSAQLVLPGETGERTVRVRNLSAGGLMIECERLLPVGTTLLLALRGVGEVQGHVAWCAEGRMGIALDQPIDPKRARKPVGGGTGTPDYVKPPRG